MQRWSILALLGLIVVVGASMAGKSLQSVDATLTATGHVYIATAEDGLTTAVTLDSGDSAHPPDGTVDHAFRLQHKDPQRLVYDGAATVTFEKTRLTIQTEGQSGWIFSVDGVATSLGGFDAGYVPLGVVGLSHHWGKQVNGAPDAVASWLLATGCVLGEGGPVCENCGTGGPGAQGCGSNCGGDSDCSVMCDSGGYACCRCPAACVCCRVIERGSKPLSRKF